jgi:hypothetical protein
MASSLIGALKVSLGIDSSEFETGLKKARGTADGFALSISKGLVGGLTSAAAGFFSLNAIIGGVNRTLEKFGAVADRAKSAGLDPEFFQALTHGASLAGVSMETLSGALDSFNKSMGLASEGKGKLVSQLEVLNPELLKNLQLSTDQETRIKLVADALRDEADASQKAALAAAVFGAEGVKLVSVLEGGARAIDDLVTKARSMGLIVSRDLIERADELGDRLDTASQIVETQLNVGFAALAPLIVDASSAAGELLRLLGLAYEQTKDIEQRQFLRPMQNELANTYIEIDKLKTQIGDLETQLAGGGNGVGMILKLDLTEAQTKLTALEAHAMRLLDRITELQGRPTTPAAPAEQVDPLAGMLGRGGPGRNTPAPRFYGPGGGSDTPDTGSIYDGLTARVDALRQSLMTEEALEQDSFSRRLEQIHAFYEQGVISQAEQDSLIEAAQQQHADRMNEIVAKQVEEEARIRNLSINGVQNLFGALAQLAESSGEKNLALSKAFGVAQAVVSTATGITRAFELPPLAAWPQAAAFSADVPQQIEMVVYP